MDLNTSQCYQGEDPQGKTPYSEDPICRVNLSETAEFVKSLPVSNVSHKMRERENVVIGNSMVRKMEAPSTPGRPVFSFSVSRKCLPSKWDDAEKWLVGGSNSCHESPAHHASNSKGMMMTMMMSKQQQNHQVFGEKFRVVDCQVMRPSNASLEDHEQFNRVIVPGDVPLKDKFTDEIGPYMPNSRYSEPTKEAFFFQSQNNQNEPMKDVSTEVIPFHEALKHRDIGTEMTPLGSSTTSRCPTPFMSTSPARHNTPASRSGPLAMVVAQSSSTEFTKQLQECHLAKLQHESTQFDSVTMNWSSREEEEEEISKSLRHFEIGRRSVSISESRSAWEEEEKTKSCLRYQREEARIQAWIELQTAKGEAQSKKLEVKIQKMRSELEEKLMKRMSIVHRKAEEWRVAAQVEHSEQTRRATQRRAQKHTLNQKSLLSTPHFTSCACCFPCTNSNH